MKKFFKGVMSAIDIIGAALIGVFGVLTVLFLASLGPLIATGLIMLAAFLFGFSISFAKAFGVFVILRIIKWMFSNNEN